MLLRAVLTDRQRSKLPFVERGVQQEAQTDESDEDEPIYRGALLMDSDDDGGGDEDGVQQATVPTPMDTESNAEQAEPPPLQTEEGEAEAVAGIRREGGGESNDDNYDGERSSRGREEIERSKERDKRQQGAIRILMRHEREQHRKRRLNNILEEYDQVLAEPAATEGEQKKQRFEDKPGEYDQERPEAGVKKKNKGKKKSRDQRRTEHNRK